MATGLNEQWFKTTDIPGVAGPPRELVGYGEFPPNTKEHLGSRHWKDRACRPIDIIRLAARQDRRLLVGPATPNTPPGPSCQE